MFSRHVVVDTSPFHYEKETNWAAVSIKAAAGTSQGEEEVEASRFELVHVYRRYLIRGLFPARFAFVLLCSGRSGYAPILDLLPIQDYPVDSASTPPPDSLARCGFVILGLRIAPEAGAWALSFLAVELEYTCPFCC
jgi:hypothetical protein